jgi:hypothetical protein
MRDVSRALRCGATEFHRELDHRRLIGLSAHDLRQASRATSRHVGAFGRDVRGIAPIVAADNDLVTDQPVRHRLTSPQWWLRDSDGKWAIAQLPNPALTVWLITAVARSIGVTSDRNVALAQVGRGALVVWAADELLRGSSPFRRLLGLIVLVIEVVGFFS